MILLVGLIPNKKGNLMNNGPLTLDSGHDNPKRGVSSREKERDLSLRVGGISRARRRMSQVTPYANCECVQIRGNFCQVASVPILGDQLRARALVGGPGCGDFGPGRKGRWTRPGPRGFGRQVHG